MQKPLKPVNFYIRKFSLGIGDNFMWPYHNSADGQVLRHGGWRRRHGQLQKDDGRCFQENNRKIGGGQQQRVRIHRSRHSGKDSFYRTRYKYVCLPITEAEIKDVFKTKVLRVAKFM